MWKQRPYYDFACIVTPTCCMHDLKALNEASRGARKLRPIEGPNCMLGLLHTQSKAVLGVGAEGGFLIPTRPGVMGRVVYSNTKCSLLRIFWTPITQCSTC